MKELFPDATHVMMQVEKSFSIPDELDSAYSVLNDGHAYVHRIKKEIDTTLTQSGKAADAKAVGDALGDISSLLDAINGEVV